jgi:hypothetical protein
MTIHARSTVALFVVMAALVSLLAQPIVPTAYSQTSGTGGIVISKDICNGIGTQDSCIQGGDRTLEGYTIDFKLYAGGDDSGTLLNTIPLALVQTGGSSGTATASGLAPGTYTVCEVPLAYKAGMDDVQLQGVPRPAAGGGGSSGGSSQSPVGDLCIRVEVTTGNAQVKFLNKRVEAATPTPTATLEPTATSTPEPSPTATSTPEPSPTPIPPGPTSTPASADGNISVEKSICGSIDGSSCVNPDASLAGYKIEFLVYPGSHMSEPSSGAVQTITVTLGEGGAGFDGSRGLAEGWNLSAGDYTVCEVPRAFRDGAATEELVGGGCQQVRVTANQTAATAFLNMLSATPTPTPSPTPTPEAPELAGQLPPQVPPAAPTVQPTPEQPEVLAGPPPAVPPAPAPLPPQLPSAGEADGLAGTNSTILMMIGMMMAASGYVLRRRMRPVQHEVES